MGREAAEALWWCPILVLGFMPIRTGSQFTGKLQGLAAASRTIDSDPADLQLFSPGRPLQTFSPESPEVSGPHGSHAFLGCCLCHIFGEIRDVDFLRDTLTQWFTITMFLLRWLG